MYLPPHYSSVTALNISTKVRIASTSNFIILQRKGNDKRDDFLHRGVLKYSESLKGRPFTLFVRYIVMAIIDCNPERYKPTGVLPANFHDFR